MWQKNVCHLLAIVCSVCRCILKLFKTIPWKIIKKQTEHIEHCNMNIKDIINKQSK